jgi:Uncharacterized component of anaerobic dehydrogenases
MSQNNELRTFDEATPVGQRAALAHSTCLLLASFYRDCPGIELVVRLRELGPDFLDQMSAEYAITPQGREALSLLVQFIKEIGSAGQDDVTCENLAVDWTRLVRGVARDYGPVPPYEALYRGVQDFQSLARELATTYRQAGIALTPAQDRPDSLVVELEFLATLLQLEQSSLHVADWQGAERYRRLAAAFLQNHLGTWVADYCTEALNYAETDFYRGVLKLTASFVAEYQEYEA